MASNMDTEKSSYYTKLSGIVRERYDEKIYKCGGIDPYIIKEKDLSTNSNDFPQISLYDVGDYMIHSRSPFTNQFLDNYKGTEAFNYFESGFVLSIGSMKHNVSAIVRGKVKHSQRMNESPLIVWILAKLSGEIICAHCTCIAGLSESCSHVGAICFAIYNIALSRETKSVTDVLCKWNVPNFKEVSMSSAKDMNWINRSHERTTLESNFLEYCNSFTHLADERIDQFVVKSHSVGDETALGTILFPSEKRRKTNIRDEVFLASLYNENYRDKHLCELLEIGKRISLNLTNDEVKEISTVTLPRLKSKCSLALRRGRITGSHFKNCCVANIDNPPITIIRRMINLTKIFGDVPSIKCKKKTIEQYIRAVGLNHENFVYNECGLIINPEIPYFAGSPDGLVSCNCHGDGCVKLKYLKTLESNASLAVMTSKPNNILNRHGNQYSLEKTHEFYYQTQLQINLMDLKYCDFVIWSRQKAITLKVTADVDFWKIAMEKALSFHEQVLMPELLGKFYTTKIDFPNSMEETYEEGHELELEELELEELELEEPELIALEIEILGSVEE